MKDALDHVARAAMAAMLRAEPIRATGMGEHAHDGQLPDYSSAARAALSELLAEYLSELDAIDDLELDHADNVDLEIMRAAILRSIFEAREVKSTTWNPMVWNPGSGLHLLLAREFAPLEVRLTSARSRLAQIPRFLEDARRELGEMPRIHVETAIGQFQGTLNLVESELAEQLGRDCAEVVEALLALQGFIDWLTTQLPIAQRDPRLGTHVYAALLWHSLDDATQPTALLERANEHLELVEAKLVTAAAEYLGQPATTPGLVAIALANIADRYPVTNEQVLTQVSTALDRTVAFLGVVPLVDIPETDVKVIEMPEIHRGVAVAYCDSPGPLETTQLPTFVAVAPAPSDWTVDRVVSFYREYNGVQLHDLTVHEAFPGHVLQLAHSRVAERNARIRAFGRSSVFIEGWAVYAEELMIDSGYSPSDDPKSAQALRLQQLKMQARMTINAILDVRVHTRDIEEQEALDLMMNRGFQEEGEAVGKWRRALLTAGQLPTYFVGYFAVRELAADLRVMHPDWTDCQIHNLLLSYGSPAPRHVRSLLGL
ncbi:MAG: DUF885 domain-containing protein [Actinomycetota bacterium]|nr:DUF885 domain-containing protein [Actinomycetota bacterium]